MGFLIFIAVMIAVGFSAINLYGAEKNIQPQSQEAIALKPDLRAFLFYKTIKSLILWLVVLFIIYFGINTFGAYVDKTGGDGFRMQASVVWMLLAAIIGLRYLMLSATYKKTKYFFYSNKIIQKGGGLFSDFEKELNLKNITHVEMMLPYIEGKLFGTGSIKVESAGSGTTEIFIKAIKRARDSYENIINLMKESGFKLTRQNLIQEERPHNLAIFFEVFRFFLGTIFFIFFIGIDLLFDNDLDIDAGTVLAKYGSLLSWGIFLVLIGVLIYCVIRFMDLKQRIYRLYEDAITYSEGFFNKHASIVPFENLADSAISQSFISKIFSLYDVKLSCQGSGKEILFKNMVNGEKLSENIDKLVDKTKNLVEAGEKEKVQKKEVVAREEKRKAKIEADREFRAEFKMNSFRTWLPVIIVSPILLIFFPVLIIAAIGNAIRISCNRFQIKKDSAVHVFDFFSKKKTEFSFDKITGIVFKEGILDRWCNTCKTIFWSIGSGTNITFSNLKKDNDFKKNILKKKGVKPQKVLYGLKPKFSFLDMLKANIYLTFIFAIITIALFFINPAAAIVALVGLAVLYALMGLYKNTYYKKSRLMFHEDYIHFSHGLFWKEDYFIFYNDIKDITTVQYPNSTLGTIRFNVAGETMVKTQQGQSVRTNAFSIKYVDKIKNWDELIDIIFYFRPQAEKIKELENNPKLTSPEAVHSTKPILANGLLGAVFGVVFLDVVIGIFCLAMQAPGFVYGLVIILNIIILISVVASIKAISYVLQPYRVYEKSGIIFKKQISVTYNKIDFINFSQGALNKMFNTGNITINTVGSSKPEIVIKNISDFKNFYDKLKQEYSKE